MKTNRYLVATAIAVFTFSSISTANGAVKILLVKKLRFLLQ